MEVTAVFKACVKAVKVKRKDLASNSSSILPSRKKDRGERVFNDLASDVVDHIKKLKNFLLQHRAAYLTDSSLVSSSMTDADRDQIDADAQIFMKSCSAAIAGIKKECSTLKEGSQLKSHVSAVIDLLEGFLKETCKLYSQQKALRLKQLVDRKRMSRLSRDVRREVSGRSAESYTLPPKPPSSNVVEGRASLQKPAAVLLPTSLSGARAQEARSFPAAGHGDMLPGFAQASETTRNVLDTGHALETLSAEEAQMFQEENDALFTEMNSLVDEVRQIEGKVVEIGQLQEIFQEKILEQAGQVEKIHETAIATTENVTEGNEQIREAIKNSATFRVWILFFLIMCTFSLLFLDWYNY